jgi:hypothetical protein
MSELKEYPRRDSERGSNSATNDKLKGLEREQLEAGINPLVADLPPDPDAHLSAGERATIVSPQSP